MVEHAPNVAALRRHRLDLVAAHRFRNAGRTVDEELRAAERIAAMRAIAVPRLLERIAASAEQPVVVMKGPEAAASYQIPACRPFKDLDILTDDADRLRAALLAAGFQTVPGAGTTEHHVAALIWPGVPLTVEVHSAPHYVSGLPTPELDDLLALTYPSRTGVAGVQGFVPAAHAVLLAVHGWAHGPLERVGHLVDVAAVLAEGDRDSAEALADRWGCQRLWRTTMTCIDALLGTGRAPITVRTWARHLRTLREPSVLESYLARVLGPMWALPARATLKGVGAEMRRTAMPYEEESWGDQMRRSARAVSRALLPVSQHRI